MSDSSSDRGPARATGRNAIVTGGDSGIGKATALALAEAGCDVGVTYRTDEQGAEDTAAQLERLGRRGEIRQLDVTDLDATRAVIDDLDAALGKIDVLINNAGTVTMTPFLDTDLPEWRHVLDTDLTGPFVAAQHVARRMVDRRTTGRIVNVTSVHEHVPKHGFSAYCAAKGGMGTLTKVMALELAEHGITVNAVAPGETATPMTGQHEAHPGQQERPAIPAGRPGDAREIGAAIAFVASPEASYVTGTSLVVDGGMLLTAAVQ